MAGEKMDYDNVGILYRWTLLDLYSFLSGVFLQLAFGGALAALPENIPDGASGAEAFVAVCLSGHAAPGAAR